MSQKNHYDDLLEMVSPDDIIGIPIVADPDAIASAMALKRLFWRKVKNVKICRVNAIKRSDNLAMLKFLDIHLPYINQTDLKKVSKWALVDAQPNHHPLLSNVPFSIIIDHHPPDPELQVPFHDIREEYGAVASIMTEYLRSAGIKPSMKLATSLFYGIKTDTNNFTRTSTAADIKAFRYLYSYINRNILKKIESSEINKKNIAAFRKAFDALEFVKDTAYVHMGEVEDADALVIIADFFLKVAEASWSVISGIYGKKIIIIMRNAGFRQDAGKFASRSFGELGSAGGHKSTARAEIPLDAFMAEEGSLSLLPEFIKRKIEER